jgi:hypothetical protein
MHNTYSYMKDTMYSSQMYEPHILTTSVGRWYRRLSRPLKSEASHTHIRRCRLLIASFRNAIMSSSNGSSSSDNASASTLSPDCTHTHIYIAIIRRSMNAYINLLIRTSVVAQISAPLSRSRRTTSICPSREASWRGVHPALRSDRNKHK